MRNFVLTTKKENGLYITQNAAREQEYVILIMKMTLVIICCMLLKNQLVENIEVR